MQIRYQTHILCRLCETINSALWFDCAAPQCSECSQTARKWFEVRETLQNDRSSKNWVYQRKYELGIIDIISISYLKGENCCDKLKPSCLWLGVSSVLKFCSVAAVNETTVRKLKVENYAASLRKRAFSNCPGWVTISMITHKMIGCIPYVYEVTSVVFRLKCRI